MKLSHNRYLNKVSGNIKPLKGKVLVKNLDFGQKMTKGGIIIPDDDGKERGIHPRWAQVWKVGEGVELKEGDWVLVDHGRWTRTINYSGDEGDFPVNAIDYPNGVLIVSDEKPDDR